MSEQLKTIQEEMKRQESARAKMVASNRRFLRRLFSSPDGTQFLAYLMHKAGTFSSMTDDDAAARAALCNEILADAGYTQTHNMYALARAMAALPDDAPLPSQIAPGQEERAIRIGPHDGKPGGST